LGKVYVDYLRNGKGQTTAAAFSARARPGMGVSMPLAWEQLADLKSGAQWNVQTAREYLSFQSRDPWAGFWSTGQSLSSAIERLA
jgi:bifunctional non-homologous end joining protein LigD